MEFVLSLDEQHIRLLKCFKANQMVERQCDLVEHESNG